MRKNDYKAETLIWEDADGVHVEPIVNESVNTSLEPHPTISRIVTSRGKVTTIHSDKSYKDGYSTAMMKALLHESIRQKYRVFNNG